MTDHKPNCSTCTRGETNPNDDFWCGVRKDWLDCTEIDHIAVVGCLSHPDAKAWLMRDVIEELETRKTQKNRFGDQRMVPAYQEAITLIRDGVKRGEP